MDTKKRNMIIGAGVAAVIVIALGLLAALGVLRGFNPEGYVKAVLDQSLKGEVKMASQLMEGTTEAQLYEQYEAGIASFVKNSTTSGVELDEELQGKYVELCKKIFNTMKYEIKSAKNAKDGGYQVTVSYQSSNVFVNFIAKISEENARIVEKVQKGEYRGTLEEINNQMQQDFLTNAYTILEECYKTNDYGKEETYIFTIEKDGKGMYDIREEQISEFIKKILDLDEKEG